MFDRDLNEITAFLAVAREGGFTAAAEKEGLPKSYLSRKVSDLEGRLGLRLLNRTTRSVSLTDDGQRYYESCQAAFGEIQDIEEELETTLDNPSGHIRVTCPVEFGNLITEKVTRQFLIKYPNLSVEVFPTNSVVDLVRDQFDVAIRPSNLADPDMIALRLGVMCWGLYTSPLWAKNNLRNIKKPEDLREYNLIAFNPSGKVRRVWKQKVKFKGKEVLQSFQPHFVAGNLSTLVEATVQGAGMAALPEYLIQRELNEKKLVRVLSSWLDRKTDMYAVYSSRRNMPSRMRVFLDYLRESDLFSIS